MLDKLSWSPSTPVVPIPRWGLEPFVDEPAHGFFLRLAALNGQQAIPAYAMSLGLNGRNIDPQQMLHFCEQLPIPGTERLRAATPSIAKRSVYIRGEHLRLGRDWSIRHRRYCLACVNEKSFHRFWFDLPIVRVCPIHQIELASERRSMKWAWHHPLQASDMAVYKTDAALTKADPGLRFSSYILGRLGVLQPSPISLLDSLRLSEAVYLCSIIGKMLIHGWKPVESSKHESSQDQQFMEAGYTFLDESGSLAELLERHIRESPNCVDGVFGCKDIQKNLGWLYDALYIKQYRRGLDFLMKETNRVLERFGACRRLRRKFPIAADERRAREIAAALGLRIDEVIQLAKWNPRLPESRLEEFEVETIKRRASRMISAEAATDVLGVSAKRFASMRSHGIFAPVIEAAAGKSSQYDRNEIEGIVLAIRSRVPASTKPDGLVDLDNYRAKAFCSYLKAVTDVLAGTVEVRGWDTTKPGLQAVLLSASNSHPQLFRTRRAAETPLAADCPSALLDFG
ncbi:TniQ family protein [Mesorhizobium sp.]|uniref:TniQ family protein n=1 Tax=Mesorhizobium sp. TaxID=1871066 RepID=UPI0025D7F15D|nr:TniQ family protein [Mesorhizobium sp.]